MDTMDAIYHRRSVRNYSDEAVSGEDFQKIIAAGMMAPSAGNQQPWHFITVTKKETLLAVTQVNPNAGMASKAPAGILVCGDKTLEKYPGYWIQDCSASVQNMLLTIHAMNLAAVWTGIWPVQDRVEGFIKLFGLPDSVLPLGFIVLGHPMDNNRKGNPPDRFRPDRIHTEQW